MKTKNFNLLFYLKKIKGYQSGEMPLYLRISVDGKRSEATIGRGIELGSSPVQFYYIVLISSTIS
ncbi:hypothetical protein ABIB62_000416 [Mucilaginibacter sp. UYP25]